MHADLMIVGPGSTGLLLAESAVPVSGLGPPTTDADVTRAFAVRARAVEQRQVRGVIMELTPTGARRQAMIDA